MSAGSKRLTGSMSAPASPASWRRRSSKKASTVKEGDQLFRIDQAPFEAALQQARGALLQAQGTLTNRHRAASARRRTGQDQRLRSPTRDERVAAEQNAKGAVVIADANEKTAAINLGYTTSPPRSPDGSAGPSDQGQRRWARHRPAVLIVSQDPMYVTFPVSQREFLRVRQEGSKTRTG